eukprot:jgi/Botrbrau1/11828/Bobra.0224s0024.1
MECRPFKDPRYDLHRLQHEVSIQASLPRIEAEVQATCLPPRDADTQYHPLLDTSRCAEEELLISVADFLQRVLSGVEEVLMENQVLDMYTDDLGGAGREDAFPGSQKDDGLSRVSGAVAVACTDPTPFRDKLVASATPVPHYVLVWNLKDPIRPEYVLQSPSEVYVFQINPSNPMCIAAGCHDGRVLLWDCTAQEEALTAAKVAMKEGDGEASANEVAIPMAVPSQISPPELSHRAAISALSWLPGLHFMRDGRLMKVSIEDEQRQETVRAHAGSLTVVQHSPFFEDVILTVGGYTFALWREGCERAPLMQSRYATCLYTTGCWSPARPGVLYLGREDGALEVWDLQDRNQEPSIVAQPCARPVSSLAFSPSAPPGPPSRHTLQQLLAVGDAGGVLHILDLPRSLRKRGPTELKTVAAFLDRETRRVAQLATQRPSRAQALKRSRTQQRHKRLKEEKATQLEGTGGAIPLSEEELFLKANEAYQQLEKQFRAELVLLAVLQSIGARGGFSVTVSATVSAPAGRQDSFWVKICGSHHFGDWVIKEGEAPFMPIVRDKEPGRPARRVSATAYRAL